MDMITIAFFNQNFLTQREIITALKTLSDVKVVVFDTPSIVSADQSVQVTAQLQKHDIRFVFTVNNWGLDPQNILADFMERAGIIHCNWHVDDPFFMEYMCNVVFRPATNRIDFASDRGFVPLLTARGYATHFLPLASDPSIFFPDEATAPKYELLFVGNSYCKEMGDFSKGLETYIEKAIPVLGELIMRYRRNMAMDCDRPIADYLAKTGAPVGVGSAKAEFLLKYATGYLFRKQIVSALIKKYETFMVSGDAYWQLDIQENRLAGGVNYYDGLCDIYRKTKINIDINRVFIKDGFTQRVFDCLACGSFLMTSPKAVIGEYFKTSGTNQEIVVFENEEDLFEKIGYYRNHPDDATAIARRGREMVLARHTYEHRVWEIFSVVKERLL